MIVVKDVRLLIKSFGNLVFRFNQSTKMLNSEGKEKPTWILLVSFYLELHGFDNQLEKESGK